VALLATHYSVDFAEHYLAELIAARGMGFLGWNTRYRGMDEFFLLDRALVDVGAGVRWLREHGAEVVVLVGNSGGGSLMAAYHAQTRRPVVTPARGLPPVAGLDELPAGDLYVSVAAHPGRPDVLTGWLDPSVADESDPASVDPSLDMYEPANGPPYPPAFVDRYRQAQRRRNQRITDWALAELDRLAGRQVADRIFAVPRTWADLRFLDGSLDPSDRTTPGCYLGDPRRANYGPLGLASACSLRTWLSMWSLTESQCRASEHLALLDVPALVVNATRDSGVFPSDAQAIYDTLGTGDRTRLDLDADHYFVSPTGARHALADAIAAWVAARAGGG
jgi:acetyl esterase/lipase